MSISLPDITITAPAVAWYGAIVGTLGLAISGFTTWRDRRHLVVRASDNYRVSPGGQYDATKYHIMVTVANAGRRSATVTHVYLRQQGAATATALVIKDWVVPGGRELKEGQIAIYVTPEEGLKLDQITKAVAIDGTGKEWTGKFLHTPRGS